MPAGLVPRRDGAQQSHQEGARNRGGGTLDKRGFRGRCGLRLGSIFLLQCIHGIHGLTDIIVIEQANN